MCDFFSLNLHVIFYSVIFVMIILLNLCYVFLENFGDYLIIFRQCLLLL